MKDETKGKLAQLLEMDEKRAQEAQKRKEAEKSAEELFLESWRAHRDATVMPALQAFAEQLKAAGHDARVITQAERLGAHGRVEQAEGVILKVVRKGAKPDNTIKTELTFHVSPRNKKVSLHYGLTSSSGPWGEFTMDAVTAEFAEAKALAWLDALFKGGHRPEDG